jgi:hypothetical protein
MKWISRTRLACAVGVIVTTSLTASVSTAQPSGRKGSPSKSAEAMSPMQVHQLFDTMLVRQAQHALGLTDQQHTEFVARVQALQDTRRRNQQARVAQIAELQRLTNPRNGTPAADEELTRRLMALQEMESRAAAELRRAYNDVDKLLTPLQQARFRVLEEQIERRKLQLVGRARQNMQPRQNGQRPPRRPPGS